MFMRDAKQAEVLLSQQDNFLSKEEVPVSVVFNSCVSSTILFLSLFEREKGFCKDLFSILLL
jgi:hypothetical protein